MAIVWLCPLSVDAYIEAGRNLELPRPDCPSCASPMWFWSGYRRHVRVLGRCREIFVARVACKNCSATHALLPSFTLLGRLDVAETIGSVIEEVVTGLCGVRPVAKRLELPHTTVREWIRRFVARSGELAVSFAGLAVELGAEVLAPLRDPARDALRGIWSALEAASALPGWSSIGLWRFTSAVCGGRLLSTNTNSPYLIIGKRRFMPPVPLPKEREGGSDGT